MNSYKLFINMVVIALLASGFAYAQDKEASTNTAPTDRGVARYLMITDHVKPECDREWRKEQRSRVIPVLKQAGAKSRKVYHTVLGDTTEYVSYIPFPDYAIFDEEDVLQKTLGKNQVDRINTCLSSSYQQLVNSQNEFFADPGNASALLTSSYRVTSGRSGDYMKFLREELLQPIKKAVEIDYIKGFSLLLTNQGGETGIYIMNMHYANFKDLEGPTPVAHVLGPEGTMEFIRKGADLITPLGQIVRQYESELSF